MHPDTERFMQFIHDETGVTANAPIAERATGVSSAAVDGINETFAASKDGEHTTETIYPEEP